MSAPTIYKYKITYRVGQKKKIHVRFFESPLTSVSRLKAFELVGIPTARYEGRVARIL